MPACAYAALHVLLNLGPILEGTTASSKNLWMKPEVLCFLDEITQY